jgi:ferredoxin
MSFISTNCKEVNCGHSSCETACPSGALALARHEEPFVAEINSEKCFSCGLCVQLQRPEHPYLCTGLRVNSAHKDRVISWIEDMYPLAVVIGPGLHFYKQHIKFDTIYSILTEKMGAVVVDLAILSAEHARQAIFKEARNRLKSEDFVIDSRCASICNLIERQFIELAPRLIRAKSTGLTAAAAASIKMKDRTEIAGRRQSYRVIFLGPCIAYKELVDRSQHADIDAVITWPEFDSICKFFDIELENYHVPPNLHVVPPDERKIPTIPAAGDMSARFDQDVPCIDLSGLNQAQLYSYLLKLDQAVKNGTSKQRGFITAFWYGSCLNGPGVYRRWNTLIATDKARDNIRDELINLTARKPKTAREVFREHFNDNAIKEFAKVAAVMVVWIVRAIMLIVVGGIAWFLLKYFGGVSGFDLAAILRNFLSPGR